MIFFCSGDVSEHADATSHGSFFFVYGVFDLLVGKMIFIVP